MTSKTRLTSGSADQIGILSNSTTTDKSSLINISNEVNSRRKDLGNNVKDYLASGSAQTTTGSITTGTPTLTLASALDFKNNQGINVFGIYEVASLSVTAGASSSSNCTVTLNGIAQTVALTSGNTAIQVATAIRATAFAGWTTGGSGTTVTFTATTTGNKTDATYTVGTTGATATMTTPTQGTSDFITTITSGAGTTSLVLAANAATTVSSVTVAHEDTVAIQAAITANVSSTSKCIFLPTGAYITSSLTNLNKVVLLGDNATLTVGGTSIPINQIGGAAFNNSSNYLTKVINKMQLGLTVKIVCYGDSTTYGDNGSGVQTANPYPQTLQARLRTIYSNTNITVINNGTNGQQSSTGLANFDSVITSQSPDLVIVMYGINDISGMVLPTNSIEVYKNDIIGMVEKSIANQFGVLLLTPTFTQYTNGSNVKIESYGEAVIEIAKRYSIPYVDMHKAQQDIYLNGSTSPGKMMMDAAHFTDVMYQLNADIVLLNALDINMGKSLNVRTNDILTVPAINSKYIKTDCSFLANNSLQFNFNNYLFLKDGSWGTYLSFEFYISKSGMDLYAITPMDHSGGKLTVVDNGVNLPNPINFYSEESVLYDAQNLVYENIPLGYHKLEFKIANLVAGDASTGAGNPAMYASYFQFRPTEISPSQTDVYLAGDATNFAVVEKFIPIVGGGVRHNSKNTINSILLHSGKFAQLKNGKTFVLEFDGYLFDKFGVSWFGNVAGSTNTSGLNNGFVLIFNTTTVNLNQASVGGSLATFTSSTVTLTLDYSITHRVRIEQTYAGAITIYIDGTLRITCTSKQFNNGFFGLYNQAVASQSARLSRFEYAYI